MTIVRTTEPAAIYVDDCKTKADFRELANEIARALQPPQEQPQHWNEPPRIR